MKFLKIVFFASILLSFTACDIAYWDCKREMKNQGYESGDAARECKGN
mgnify:CR=1 FL=1